MNSLTTRIFFRKLAKCKLLHSGFWRRLSTFECDSKLGVEPSPFVADKSKSALEKYKGRCELTLVERQVLTHDSYLFRFSLPEKNLVIGTNVANHIRLTCIVPTKEYPAGVFVKRKYTPTSDVAAEGYVDLPIKIQAEVHPNFPNGGELTPYLENLKIGEKILADGPYTKFEYFGNGCFKINSKFYHKKNVGFVAGGTGISVFYPVIKAAVEANDPTCFSLIYANKSEKDIIFHKELKNLQRMSNSKFKMYHIISNPQEDHKDSYKGLINKEILMRHLPPPSEDCLIINMGPKPMNEKFADIMLSESKYDPKTMILSKAVNQRLE